MRQVGTTADDVRLRPACDADWPMIRRWLAQPEVIRWWGPKATTEAEVMLAMGTRPAICRIIEARPSAAGAWEAAGYAHALDVELHGEDHGQRIEPGAWEIDLFIAAPHYRGRGAGVRALELIREEVFTTTLCMTVCIFVGIGNEKAVRAYEKAGFRWRTVSHDASKGPQWVMFSERVPVRRQV